MLSPAERRILAKAAEAVVPQGKFFGGQPAGDDHGPCHPRRRAHRRATLLKTAPPVFGTTAHANLIGGAGLRDAQAAVYAAYGACRATGCSATVATFGLREALSAAGGLVACWSDRLPVTVVTAVSRAQQGRVRAAFEPLCQLTLPVFRAKDISKAEEALSPAERQRGPVHLAVSQELLPPLMQAVQKASRKEERRLPAHKEKGLPQADLSWIENRLRGARRPLLLVGAGVTSSLRRGEGTEEKVAWLSDGMDIPVLLTASATCMPVLALERWRRAFAVRGALLPAGNPVWVREMMASDFVLALGSALSEVDGFGLRELKLFRGELVHVDVQKPPVPLASRFVQVGAEVIVDALLKQLRGSPPRGKPDRPRLRRVKLASRKWRRAIAGEAGRLRRARVLEPSFAAHEILHTAHKKTVFISEGGACGMWIWSHLWLRPFCFPVQQGTIGVSIPMSIGVKRVLPDHDVVCVVGDGAFYYHVAELATLKELGLPVTIYCFNDRSWGAIRLGQNFMFRTRTTGTDVPDQDYASVARGLGVEGLTARTPGELSRAVAAARRSRRRGPLLVDVKIARDRIPYSGLLFVAAEFDGATRTMAGELLASGLASAVKGRVPLDLPRVMARMLWP